MNKPRRIEAAVESAAPAESGQGEREGVRVREAGRLHANVALKYVYYPCGGPFWVLLARRTGT